MRVRARGFALIIVVVAVAGVFALAMRSAVVARMTTVEARRVSERVSVERDARSAVALVLRGLVPAEAEGVLAEDRRLGSGGGGAFRPAASIADEIDESSIPELPPGLEALLGELVEVEEEAAEELREREARRARAAASRGMNGASGRSSIERTIAALGLPAGEVRVELNGSAYMVELGDAQSTLDVNRAEVGALATYFRAKGVGETLARRIAEEIADYRDEDSVSRTYGAERSAYAVRGLVPRDGEIRAVEELLYLPSMTRELFDGVRDELSVVAPLSVHAGSASAALLRAVGGVSEEVADEIVRARSESPLTEERLAALLPAGMDERARKRLTVRPSGFLSVRVRVVGVETGAERWRFAGSAVLAERGVAAIGLAPVE